MSFLKQFKKFPFYRQLDQMDCGPTCLRMIAKFHGRDYTLQELREKSFITREGVSLLGISEAAEAIGMRTLSIKIDYNTLLEDVPTPCIAHWNQKHFVVVYKVEKDKVYVSDPAMGRVVFTKEEFCKSWVSTRENNEDQGIVMVLEPTPEFYSESYDEKTDKTEFKFLFKYLFQYKKYIVQLFLGLFLGSLLGLLFPFLTQSIVDIGINQQNVGFIYLILAAQLMLFASQTAVGFIRSWIMLHISTRVNISIISDFLIKLMKLPISFFDTKMTGDLMQRISDHHRIEDFLTGSTLNTLFSLVNFVVFGAVMIYYNVMIFIVFVIGSSIYVAWIMVFLKQRKVLDYKRFNELAANQSSIIQLITGMQEIKLNNCERQKRWEWERLQAKLFKIGVKGLALEQYQNLGSFFINEVKNIIISFLSAKAVIDGQMTLGMMLSVQYILGQLNGPLNQLIGFIQSAQDAKISMERLGEIHNKDDEDSTTGERIGSLPEDRSLHFQGVGFQYEGPSSPHVLQDINLTLQAGKVTAIVGSSGSGKTTLVKLLLKFYKTTEGKIKVGNFDMENFHSGFWRDKCGAVMQDGFIFSDTIANNIAAGDENPDKKRLLHAVKTANIQEFVESLPLGYNTKIGRDGSGLSGGQKQRVLIARAIYKNPEYIFFDEATSALDANNEKVISENLAEFYKGKTVVIVAHRLSTVRNADLIVVLEKGKIVETGAHADLVALRGRYYDLVKNQLELGS